MSSEKLERRKKMGDDPTAMSKSNTTEAGAIAPQPLPGSPQGQGNMMNNPLVGLSMGDGQPQSGSISGVNKYPYGDGGIPSVGGQTGSVGYAKNSGMPQNLVPGQVMNQQPYNAQMQPQGDTQLRMDSLYMGQQAQNRAMALYGARAGGDPNLMQPSYQVMPMGMYGTPVETAMQQPMPGAMNPAMDYRNQDQLTLEGLADTQGAAYQGMVEGPMGMKPGKNQMGMSTKRGGGRNKKA